MGGTSPIRRLAQQDGVVSGKVLRYFAVCFIFVICVLIFEYFHFNNAQNIPKIFQSIGFVRSTSLTRQNVTFMNENNASGQTTSAQRPLNKKLEAFKRTHFMTVSGNGRLGNQMFEVAALIGTACRHNYTPFVSKRHRINNVFDLKQAKDIHMTNIASAGEGRAGAYNSKIETLSHDKNWTLNGYFQSWKYFHHCRGEVVSSFKFKPNTKRKAQEVLKTLNAKGRALVGVHVRRSDMASSRELRRGYNVATPEYMNKALGYFRNNTENPLFVVVSDDRHWTAAHVRGKDVVYAGTGSAESDMVILSLCNHNIITSGSFGWWGAYLSGGKTVYFSNFPSHGSWLSKQYEPGDYYPSEWIGME